MSRKDGVGQILKTCVTVVTCLALTRWFRVITATLHNLLRLTRGTHNAIGPAQLTNRLITLHLLLAQARFRPSYTRNCLPPKQ
jgi:hypothetical protein